MEINALYSVLLIKKYILYKNTFGDKCVVHNGKLTAKEKDAL